MESVEAEFRIERASSPAAEKLIAELDQELESRYPGTPLTPIDALQLEAEGGVFAIGYVNGIPVACGAIRPYGVAAEIRHMFVEPDIRRRGLGRQMLLFLEREAAHRGYRRAVLETGDRQTEAVGLYASSGWEPMPILDDLAENARIFCFEKYLV